MTLAVIPPQFVGTRSSLVGMTPGKTNHPRLYEESGVVYLVQPYLGSIVNLTAVRSLPSMSTSPNEGIMMTLMPSSNK